MNRLEHEVQDAAKKTLVARQALIEAMRENCTEEEKPEVLEESTGSLSASFINAFALARDFAANLFKGSTEQEINKTFTEERISIELEDIEDDDSDTEIIKKKEGVFQRLMRKLDHEKLTQEWIQGPYKSFVSSAKSSEVLRKAQEFVMFQCRQKYLEKLKDKVERIRNLRKREEKDS